jgi:hypothetical protein
MSSSSSTALSSFGVAYRNRNTNTPQPAPYRNLVSIARKLDYQLIKLDKPPEVGNEVYLETSERNKILRPKNIILEPARARALVWVVSAISGPVMGSLLLCPRFVKMAGWPSFEEVWVVQLERKSCKYLRSLCHNLINKNSGRRLRVMGYRR